MVAVSIDILDNGREHCLIVKDLRRGKEGKSIPIFNVRPEVSFSEDGGLIYFVQRSEEGGWIELVQKEV